VTPRLLRVSRINLPICSGVYFKPISKILPYGNSLEIQNAKVKNYSRTGT
jgi:hypothetical protein